MKEVNKILLLFLVILFGTFFVFWEGLQTNWVGEKVSRVVTAIVKQRINGDFQFDKIDFKFYPPGAELENVRFDVVEGSYNLKAKYSGIGVYFNPLSFLDTSFKMDEVVLRDGNISITPKSKAIGKKTAKNKEINIDDLDILKKIPVRKLRLERSEIKYNKIHINTQSVLISNKSTYITIVGDISNFDVSDFIKRSKHLDRVSFDLDLDKNKILVRKFDIFDGLLYGKVTGEVESYLSKNAKYNLKYRLTSPIQKIHEYLEFRKVGNLRYGELALNGAISGKGKVFKAQSDLRLDDFETDFAYGKTLDLSLSINNDSIWFDKFYMTDDEGSLKLTKSFEFFNFNNKQFVNDTVKVDVKNLSSLNFLHFLRDSMDKVLSTRVTGKVTFDLFSRNHYEFKILKGATSEMFKLGGVGDRILGFKRATFEQADFIIKKNKFEFKTIFETKNSKLNVNGIVSDGDVKIWMDEGKIELEEFSPIVGLKFGGVGDLKFTFDSERKGGTSLIVLNKTSTFNFEGYRLDHVDAETTIDLEKSRVHITKLEARSGRGSLNADLLLQTDNLDITGKLEASQLNLNEMKKILTPILGDFALTNKEISGDFDLKSDIGGKVSLEGIVLNAKIESGNMYFFNEVVDDMQMDFQLKKEQIKVSNFVATKTNGLIRGNLNYNIEPDVLDYKMKVENINLSDLNVYNELPLNMRGIVLGHVSGTKSERGHDFDLNLFLKKCFVENVKYQDSKIRYNSTKLLDEVDISLFKNKVKLKAKFDKTSKLLNSSNFKLDLNIPEVDKVVTILSGTNSLSSKLKGKLIYNLSSSFNYNSLEFDNIMSNLKILELRREPVKLTYYNSRPEIIVERNEIKRWDLNLRGRKIYFISKGEGKFTSVYDILTRVKFDASLMEVFSGIIKKTNGNVRMKIHNFKNENKEDYTVNVTSNNLSLDADILPTAVTKADLRLSYKDNKIYFDKFIAQLVNGFLKVSGTVDVNGILPEFNLRYVFKEAGMSVFSKSNLIFSGEGSFVGKSIPYNVSGDFFIQKLNIVNEVTDFTGGDNDFLKEKIDFLPGNTAQALDQFVNFNINIETRNPIFISNSIADIGLTGSVRLLGGEKDPRLAGEISLSPRNNKVTFKNNEFELNKGNIFFLEQHALSNPELDILATSKVGTYKVAIKVLGPVEEFDLSLTSEPSLSQSDILSLIAFGYTEDLSQNLSDAEKESMTKAGVGSILFDSFKINETLKKEFGLQINLGTEISEEESSYLAQSNSEGSDSNGNVTSATTFEVQKEISEDVSVKVTSTVGTNSSQKQSMNVNYNVNKILSLEGVYESDTGSDTESSKSDTSVGGDVIWKWSFK